MLTVYGIANCDKIRNLRRRLEQEDIDYRFHDYRKQGCTPALVGAMLDALGQEALVNTRGSTWRSLPEEDRRDLDRDRAGELMCAHPALIRRPLLEWQGQWLLAPDEAALQTLFKKTSNRNGS